MWSAAIDLVNPLTIVVVTRQLPDCGVGRVYIPLISDARRHYVTCDKEKLYWAHQCIDIAPSTPLTPSS